MSRIETDTVFVRRDFLAPEPPPASYGGFPGWARRHLFSSPLNIAISLMMLLFIAWALPPLPRPMAAPTSSAWTPIGTSPPPNTRTSS